MTRPCMLTLINKSHKSRAFGKPTITPKTPCQVKDLHGGMRLRAGCIPLHKTVDNLARRARCTVESGRSEKNFSTT